MLKTLEKYLPTTVADYFKNPVLYDLLPEKGKNISEPPHPFYTVSTSFTPWTSFDCQVYTSETMMDPGKHLRVNLG